MDHLHLLLVLLLGTVDLVRPSPAVNTLNSDGSYSFHYDTNTGGFHSQSGSAQGAQTKYGFNIGEGSLNVQLSGAGGSNGGGGAPTSYSAGGGNGGSGTLNLNLNPDGSYSYNYDLNDQGKSESRGTDGEVKGNFHYTGKDGDKKSIEYTAGVGGFQPVGAHIPVADSEGASPYAASPYGGGGGDPGSLSLSLNPGGEYEYSYNLKDQAKSESGVVGKVKGKFSFTGPDGQSRSIHYTADERGFLPEGDHIPKPVNPEDAPAAGSPYSAEPAPSGAGSYSYNYDANEHSKSESGGGGSVSGKYNVDGPGNKQSVTYTANGGYNPIVEAHTDLGGGNGGGGYDDGGSGGSGGAYSYKYSADAHDHSEQGSSGDVSGAYSVKSTGGDQKSSYTAGKGGFSPIHSITINLG